MKLLVALCALIALCTVNAIPLVPEDNSHYVEGVSRYIWMPDGDGNPRLVDLYEPADENFLASRNGNKNQYWLFTRQNRNNRQVLVNGNANSIRNSFYRGNRPTAVIAHGWNSGGTSSWVTQMVTAFLDRADMNVIVLDWSSTASGLYTTSVRAVPDVGRHLANFLRFLFNTAGGNWNNVHLVGHSLGAHVMGNAGRAAPSRPVRVTGLDPAGPQWGGNSNALNRNSATYVESIHTDGGSLGIMDPISHADFYPNGGRNPQPGCSNSVCSHGRAQLLFSSTIRSDHLNGKRCANLDQARRNQCTGASLKMGNSNLGKRGSGLYGLSTKASWPF
ncbi:insect intestinal lipase 6 [Danaus plexippus plexippus]|uniref:Insect intestinal lipase 6 n=1 Tax=Danaus plexippus plexippus TaxID=278856 RepID=A0A212FLK2_DANPL|nr:pancreatic triacylglycerol lipase-like [Danaus plexippus plexippus]OWR54623.1 insect intestinal lipase 6 [Danaus plexippus plexippus]